MVQHTSYSLCLFIRDNNHCFIISNFLLSSLSSFYIGECALYVIFFFFQKFVTQPVVRILCIQFCDLSINPLEVYQFIILFLLYRMQVYQIKLSPNVNTKHKRYRPPTKPNSTHHIKYLM